MTELDWFTLRMRVTNAATWLSLFAAQRGTATYAAVEAEWAGAMLELGDMADEELPRCDPAL